MELVVRDRCEDLRTRHQTQPERARSRLPPASDDGAVAAAGLDPRHLLLEDRRNERLEDRPGPPDTETPEPPIELADSPSGNLANTSDRTICGPMK